MTGTISPASALRKIAHELFGPSDELLLQTALEGREFLVGLPQSARQTIEQEPFRSRLTILKEGLDWGRANHGIAAEEEARQQINRFQARPEDAPSRSGQIRWVNALDLDEPESDFRTTTPLLVLLDQMRDADSAEPVWNGWVASRHAEFAGWWDMVLQGDAVPGDVAMVQCWNRVSVVAAHLGRTLYQLAPAELQAVRAVWDEYAGSAPEDAESEWSESLVGYLQPRETLGGIVVVTGTPLASESDVRLTFESLTRRAGGVVTSACRALVQRSSSAEQPSVATKLRALLAKGRAVLELQPFSPGAKLYRATASSPASRFKLKGQPPMLRLDADLQPVPADAAAPIELHIAYEAGMGVIPHEGPFELTARFYLLRSDGVELEVGIMCNGAEPGKWKRLQLEDEVQLTDSVIASDRVACVVRRSV